MCPLSKLSEETPLIFYTQVVPNQMELKDIELINDTMKEKKLTYTNIYYDAFLSSDSLVDHFMNF